MGFVSLSPTYNLMPRSLLRGCLLKYQGMNMIDNIKPKNEPVELGQLLSNTIGSVVQAQEKLDQYTQQRKQAYLEAEAGELALPPLWYVFSNVAIEMELSASVAEIYNEDTEKSEPYIISRTLNETSVGLYGYQASSGLKVRVLLAPQGMVPIKEPVAEIAADRQPGSEGEA